MSTLALRQPQDSRRTRANAVSGTWHGRAQLKPGMGEPKTILMFEHVHVLCSCDAAPARVHVQIFIQIYLYCSCCVLLIGVGVPPTPYISIYICYMCFRCSCICVFLCSTFIYLLLSIEYRLLIIPYSIH